MDPFRTAVMGPFRRAVRSKAVRDLFRSKQTSEGSVEGSEEGSGPYCLVQQGTVALEAPGKMGRVL